MAQVDVTELLSDPDFVDPIELVTRVTAINNFGENIIGEKTTPSVGCIQPADTATVEKLPDALRVGDIRSFWFKGVIIAAAPGKYTSVLIFQGQRFQVLDVAPWSNFGEGYTEGLCVAEVPAA